MDNNNKKRLIQQPKQSRRDLIESAKKQWAEDANLLAQEKADIGYSDFSWDAFLELSLHAFDIEVQSKIIELQDRYKDLQARHEYIWTEDKIIDEFNQKHAIVHVDQTYILTEKINVFGGQDFSLENRQSFKTYYEDETIVCIDGIERSKADIWLKSPKRRKYKGIIFDPTSTESTRDYYNLWKGFTRESIQGNCQKFWDHVKENICSNDEDAYEYLRKWLGYIFQRPQEVHTALVLCGSQGVGKNSFVEPLGVLLGSHFAPLSSITELVSNFNYHLKNAVLIHANEALWGGNKKDIGTVKAMITEPRCLIEGKGKDRIIVRNFKHVILSSNEDWPIHLDADDRRFFVLQVGEKRKEDHAYFKAIQEELDNGGYEALLHDLLHEDLTGFNPRKLPSTSNSFSIKMRSADSTHRYIYDALNQGGFSIGTITDGDAPVWQGQIPRDVVYKDYKAWCENNGETLLSAAQFGKAIKKVIVSVDDKRSGGKGRPRCYLLPSLLRAREDFSTAFKENLKRIFDDYDCDYGNDNKQVVQAIVQDYI